MEPEPDQTGTSALHLAWRGLRGDLQRFVRRRIADSAVADDVVQEVFVKVSQHAVELRDEERLVGWIYRIARNAIADHGRRVARDRLAPASDQLDHHAGGGEDVELEPNANQVVVGWIRPFLATLSAEYREALELTELRGMSQAELARHLGISVSGAKTRVQRGRKRLREAIEACCALQVDRRGNIIDYRSRPGRCVACCDD